MEINLNAKAANGYGMFKVSKERADEILESMAEVCERAFEEFEDNYRVMVVVTTHGGSDELLFRLDVAKILTEMVSVAQTADEMNYVLYNAYVGIARVHNLIFKHE